LLPVLSSRARILERGDSEETIRAAATPAAGKGVGVPTRRAEQLYDHDPISSRCTESAESLQGGKV
jgi:hypothetical protein